MYTTQNVYMTSFLVQTHYSNPIHFMFTFNVMCVLLFDKTASCLGEKQGTPMLSNDECTLGTTE